MRLCFPAIVGLSVGCRRREDKKAADAKHEELIRLNVNWVVRKLNHIMELLDSRVVDDKGQSERHSVWNSHNHNRLARTAAAHLFLQGSLATAINKIKRGRAGPCRWHRQRSRSSAVLVYEL
jgi:hypothetical protein